MAVDEETKRMHVVVCGLGMVGLRFIEKCLELDPDRKLIEFTVFCEEKLHAYNRVGLTNFFAHREVEKMMIQPTEWYAEQPNVTVHVGDSCVKLDTAAKEAHSQSGLVVKYDYAVLATGSSALVPPIPGRQKKGVFVYRTLDDLHSIIEKAATCKRACVLGGGLLGIEAAKACYDLGLDTTIIERNPWFMNRQLDEDGSRLLQTQIEKLGLTLRPGAITKEIIGPNAYHEGSDDGSGSSHSDLLAADDVVAGVILQNNKVDAEAETIATDMIVLACGIKPRDELAVASGITVHARGGVLVNDSLVTSDPFVYAIGECVVHNNFVYGLVAPGYDMAETAAKNILNMEPRQFTGADMSTKLKLLGVHVASFGDYFAPVSTCMPITYHDPFEGVYKRLLFSKDGSRLLGGILVGDTNDYGRFLATSKQKSKLHTPPSEFILGKKGGSTEGEDASSLPDDTQICSCNNVSKANIKAAVRTKNCNSIGLVKSCTKAGTSCGGCVPLVTDIMNAELKAMGQVVTQHMCEHFPYSRTEMFEIIKVKKLKTFHDIIEAAGKKGTSGCEVCKPAIGSIIASLFNELVIAKPHAGLQDTNDRFLANIQRGGSYSVVPRVPGGEITPDKLELIGRIAKKYGLYTKITGGQRIDMFGAAREDLPDIWAELVEGGMESGHAYGKALRTVKSCVGTSWCRYGVQDAVSYAVFIENRYKGIRAPHKLKGGVSGCVRECAEAQGKDFGLVATEKGYNLYVCGNGGSKPKHALLLAPDVSEDLATKYLDRFLMYYIATADRLQRTARWLEKMDGGIEYLKAVIIDDKLGICADLEKEMEDLVGSYFDEWAAVVNDPVRRAEFKQFVNTDEKQPVIEMVEVRGQKRPADWPVEKKEAKKEEEAPVVAKDNDSSPLKKKTWPEMSWKTVGTVDDFPEEGGATIKYGDSQIAVYNFTSRGKWYATQNMCPHKQAFVLSSGIIGSEGEIPKVSCPNHKKNFSLEDGTCISGQPEYNIMAFDIRIEDKNVQLHLPSEETLNPYLSTKKWMVKTEQMNGVKPFYVGKDEDTGIEVEDASCGGPCGDEKLDW
ncbi:assimilatory sulfite reductase (NADPH) [Synchytrium microbalum]|uniref:Nitrite reductase [NAD(P)H] n=1 Tax=Synchytrium microbalum TaxID=1806994 RepID=A0A507C8Z3_9FUNG|nr:assimilatory sulfite reductase (NADPH) [Synchytrium microbalum]TPX34003.1 assimilatory sulfite reductase (NADPH) [Synchytrium microbalum]